MRVGTKLQKSVLTRQRILAAAERRFAEAGFDETRIEDIANDAGIATSAVLYHFGDKRALHRAVLSDVTVSLYDSLHRAIAGPADLPTRIEATVEALVDYVSRRPTAASLAVRQIVATDPEQRTQVGAYATRFLDTLRVAFEEGERAGVIQPIHPDPLHFVSAIAGAVLFYVAALPAFMPELPYPHLAPEQLAALKRDAIAIAQRLLGSEARHTHEH
ncbi:MAG: TetR/AcrR family transcriptional regulator [Deltaproteobacteria bacterium]|nr:TetR/AcrR family transcriptional regulator [Deltaproteobacteria bacterium]